MSVPQLYGADYSVYVRIARLALLEKGVEHELVPLDIFAAGGPPEWYREIHPFNRIPALAHGEFKLFETSAISRYVDEGFDGPALQPADARQRAAMNQIIGLLDSYAYRSMVWDIYVETVEKPKDGKTPDQGVVDIAVSNAEKVLSTLSRLKRGGPYLLGDELSLADLHAAPIFGYFMKAPVAEAMMQPHTELQVWWERFRERPSYKATEPTG